MSKELTIDQLYRSHLNEINKTELKILSNISKYNNSDEKHKKELLKLKQLEKKKKNYLLSNSNDLFNYFECKQQIEKNKHPKKMIHLFFNREEEDSSINILNKSIQNYIKKNNFSSINMNDFMYDNTICNKCKKG